MFESLSDRLGSVFEKLRARARMRSNFSFAAKALSLNGGQ